MKDLSNFALIGADNPRTRAYLQLLFRGGYRLHTCYIMAKDTSLLEQAAAYTETKLCSDYFEWEQPILYTLQKAGVPYVLVQTDSINDDCVRELIRGIEEQYLIYSGFGGQIIKKELFDLGKTFIHVHSGILPQYRGSTTVYYSLLQEGICGASAIIMTPKLDDGNVIAEARFPMPPKDVNIDYIYDPYIRAKVLIAAIDSFVGQGVFTGRKQKERDERTYYIAHPVLRHIVRLAQDSEGGV
ncbi:MAG: hypothetical protein HFF33_06780 [Oscillospiraceae bacterium]|nr:hypothetical protein [Oscillospiraceae bacterium]